MVHTASDWIQLTQELLQESVQLRRQADVPICCHLSGGLDSSGIAGLLAQSGPTLTCFSVSFPEDGLYDEIQLARETSHFLGASLEEVEVRLEEVIAHLPAVVWHTEGLVINAHGVAKYLLNRRIRQAGFNVTLTGEGADEIFGGYAHLQQDWRRSQGLDPRPGSPVTLGVHLPQGPGLSVQILQDRLGFVPTFLEAKATLGARLHSFFQPDFRPGGDPFETLLQAFPPERLHNCFPADTSAWLWIRLSLANYILRTVGDGAEMAQGVEGRLPYLDHRLFETLRFLPPKLKFSPKLDKPILRQALEPYVLPAIRQRPKHPFMAPPLLLSPLWRRYLREQLEILPPFLDSARIQAGLQQLEYLPETELRAWDPAWMMVLTASLMQTAYRLG